MPSNFQLRRRVSLHLHLLFSVLTCTRSFVPAHIPCSWPLQPPQARILFSLFLSAFLLLSSSFFLFSWRPIPFSAWDTHLYPTPSKSFLLSTSRLQATFFQGASQEICCGQHFSLLLLLRLHFVSNFQRVHLALLKWPGMSPYRLSGRIFKKIFKRIKVDCLVTFFGGRKLLLETNKTLWKKQVGYGQLRCILSHAWAIQPSIAQQLRFPSMAKPSERKVVLFQSRLTDFIWIVDLIKHWYFYPKRRVPASRWLVKLQIRQLLFLFLFLLFFPEEKHETKR